MMFNKLTNKIFFTNQTSKKLVVLGSIAITLIGSGAIANATSIQPQKQQVTVNPSGIAAAINSDFQPGLNEVTFPSEGVDLVSHLYLPADYQPGEKLPAVVVTGSWTTVKEQMADLYAKRLADQGFATFTFDFRFFGESGGKPRQYESSAAKIQDIENAVAYLQTLPMVDGDRIGGLGVCASAGYMAHAIANGANLNSSVTVAAWLHDPEGAKNLFWTEREYANFYERESYVSKAVGVAAAYFQHTLSDGQIAQASVE